MAVEIMSIGKVLVKKNLGDETTRLDDMSVGKVAVDKMTCCQQSLFTLMESKINKLV